MSRTIDQLPVCIQRTSVCVRQMQSKGRAPLEPLLKSTENHHLKKLKALFVFGTCRLLVACVDAVVVSFDTHLSMRTVILRSEKVRVILSSAVRA